MPSSSPCWCPWRTCSGRFPSAEIVARRSGVDITAAGSGNPGASNTFRLLGWRAGVLVFALDVAKGAIAAGVGLLVADGHVGAYVLGIAAIIGHTFPVTRHFKGGRGVATGAGVLLVIFPVLTLACRRRVVRDRARSRTRRRSRRSWW